MHKKRSKMPTDWPIARKGTAYYSQSSHAGNKSLPVVFALRDLLKIVKTAREAKLMCLNCDVKVNQKVRKDPKFPLQILDVLTLDKTKKNYALDVEGKKLVLKEIKNSESKVKISKVSGKISLSNKKVQINLEDGNNYLFDKNFSVGDSAIIDLEKNKVEKIIPLKEGCKIKIVSGKHLGKEAELKKIIKEDNKKKFLIKLDGEEKIMSNKTIMAIE